MSLFKDLMEKISSKERRKADRRLEPGLAAFYWTNASPAEHRVRDISSTGLYLMTEERWYPGTLLMMTLQKQDIADGSADRAIAVRSKAVRWGTDGVGLEFIVQESHDRRRGKTKAENGVDRKTLEKFLAGFRPENGQAVVNCVTSPRENPL